MEPKKSRVVMTLLLLLVALRHNFSPYRRSVLPQAGYASIKPHLLVLLSQTICIYFLLCLLPFCIGEKLSLFSALNGCGALGV